jgi:hypothetical protein
MTLWLVCYDPLDDPADTGDGRATVAAGDRCPGGRGPGRRGAWTPDSWSTIRQPGRTRVPGAARPPSEGHGWSRSPGWPCANVSNAARVGQRDRVFINGFWGRTASHQLTGIPRLRIIGTKTSTAGEPSTRFAQSLLAVAARFSCRAPEVSPRWHRRTGLAVWSAGSTQPDEAVGRVGELSRPHYPDSRSAGQVRAAERPD